MGADWPAQPPASMHTRVRSNHTGRPIELFRAILGSGLRCDDPTCPAGAGGSKRPAAPAGSRPPLEQPSPSAISQSTWQSKYWYIGAQRAVRCLAACVRASERPLRHKPSAAVPVYGTKTVTLPVRGATSKPCVQNDDTASPPRLPTRYRAPKGTNTSSSRHRLATARTLSPCMC